MALAHRLAFAVLLAVILPVDQAGLAEYGPLWWVVKPIVTGAPCPECAANRAGIGAPSAPVAVLLQ